MDCFAHGRGARRERWGEGSLSVQDLSGDWASSVRPRLLWAAGLRDLRDAAPGEGFTGHAFNDAIHVDATAMRGEEAENENNGRVQGIARGNRLGKGIVTASLPELGPGGGDAQGGAPGDDGPKLGPKPGHRAAHAEL